jgi:hypothetical protein
VPPGKRRDFVAAHVRRISVWQDPEWYLVMQGHNAQIWVWSRAKVRSAEESGAAARHARIIPETLMRGNRLADGHQLIFMHNGYEGRVWNKGMLAATRWWVDIPSAFEWNLFCRSAGVALTPMPEASTQPLLDRAWSRSSSNELVMTQWQQHRRTLLVALVFSICIAFGFQLGAIAKYRLLTAATQAQIDSRRAAASDILDSRRHAEESRVALTALLGVVAKPQPLENLEQFNRAMPAGDWKAIQWYQPTPAQVQATLQGSTLDPPQIVRALDNSAVFNHVTANPTPNDINQLLIIADVRTPEQYGRTDRP